MNIITYQKALDVLDSLPHVKGKEADLFRVRLFVAVQQKEIERLNEVIVDRTNDILHYEDKLKG